MSDQDPRAATGAMTCYRHPDRETRIQCTRCGRPICTDDMIEAPVGHHCPVCAREGRVNAPRVGFAEPTVTYTLLGAIAFVFLANNASTAVFQRGALFGPLVAQGEWWRIVTSGFLHSGLLHVGFNGYLLYLLGRMLEPTMGAARFGAVYAGGLFGGAFGALLLSWSAPTVGASGAVFGLMGAALVAYRRRGVNPWRTSIGTLVLLNLAFTFLVPNISIGGHLGGLAGGAAVGALVVTFTGERRALGTALAVGSALALGAAAILVGVANPLG